MTTDEAIGWLQGLVCPIDGLQTRQYAEYDESEYCWEECAVGHHWPLKHKDREWQPDPEAVEEKLEEYTATKGVPRND
jgi:hypothetical protein